jgi:hypothetical protein
LAILLLRFSSPSDLLKFMINRKFLLYGISGLATVWFVSSASAVRACTVKVSAPGVLVQSTTGKRAVEASSGSGTPAALSVDCPISHSLQIDPPIVTTAPAGFTPTILQSYLDIPSQGLRAIASNGSAFTHAPWNQASSAVINVDVTSEVPATVGVIAGNDVVGSSPPGNYAYTAVITIFPN